MYFLLPLLLRCVAQELVDKGMIDGLNISHFKSLFEQPNWWLILNGDFYSLSPLLLPLPSWILLKLKIFSDTLFMPGVLNHLLQKNQTKNYTRRSPQQQSMDYFGDTTWLAFSCNTNSQLSVGQSWSPELSVLVSSGEKFHRCHEQTSLAGLRHRMLMLYGTCFRLLLAHILHKIGTS